VILAGNPVDRRIEMRPRMLAELQPVPRPKRAVLVIVGDVVDLDLGRVDRHLRRQLDQWCVWAEPRREINHFDPARKKLAGEFAEQLFAVHDPVPSLSLTPCRALILL
jgi:hypothetical protein